jgi:glycosyltransferase involved in cell wall biosynthesis
MESMPLKTARTLNCAKPVYIVLSTVGLGGAEKRFFEHWMILRQEGFDVHMVIDTQTYNGLVNNVGIQYGWKDLDKLHQIDLGGGAYLNYLKSVNKFFRDINIDVIIHFPLAYAPIFNIKRRHKTLISWVSTKAPTVFGAAWLDGFVAWISFFYADHIDILNPRVISIVQKIPIISKKITQTVNGTQVDSTSYRPMTKRLDFVFLGRLEPEKQALRLAMMLPAIHMALRAKGFDNYRFLMCGTGVDEHAIRCLLRTEPFTSSDRVPFELIYNLKPNEMLGKASVFFSLQRTSNYPSKALAEAMACGAYPIITDTGESRLMVEGLSHFKLVPRDFSSDDLVRILEMFLSADDVSRLKWSSEISEFARDRFQMGPQSEYFADLYSSLSKSP